MESRKQFEDRISDFAKESFFLEKKFFTTRESVKEKVNSDNHFVGYFGDTIVFDLNSYNKERIYSIASKLYNYVPECFCERLKEETMHLTLHDLSSAKRSENVIEDVQKNEHRINQLLKFMKINPTNIRMKTHYIANILNISLVLVFFPVTDVDYLKLMTIYNLFDGIRTLDYKLTPHVTLGYFNVNGFGVSSVKKLERIVNELNKEEFEIVMRTDELFYQHFTSMNDYRNIIKMV